MKLYRVGWRGPKREGSQCPICGGPLPKHGIVVEEQSRVAVIDGKVWRLPRSQIKFLCAVVRAYPDVAALERIKFRLWGEDLKEEPMTADKTVTVHAHYVKELLRTETRYRIRSVHGEGYVLIIPPDTEDRKTA